MNEMAYGGYGGGGTETVEVVVQEEDGFDLYVIRIRDNDIMEIEDISYRYPTGYDEGAIHFYWTEGNGACDCNRALEFYRARGQDNIRRSCGDSRMTLLGVWRARDGVRIASSEDPSRAE